MYEDFFFGLGRVFLYRFHILLILKNKLKKRGTERRRKKERKERRKAGKKEGNYTLFIIFLIYFFVRLSCTYK